MDTTLDPNIVNLTKAIALTESGKNGVPDYNAVGDNGTSHGAYQWQPGNFAAAASAAGLDPKDFSPANQNKVAYAQVKALHAKGFNPAQIAASWNAGEHAAQTGSWQTNVGTTTINGKPIHYDTPGYVQKVNDNYRQLAGASGTIGADQQPSGGLPQAPQAPKPLLSAQDDLNSNTTAPPSENLSTDLNKRVEDLSGAISDTASGKINPVSGVLQTAGAIAGGLGDVVHRGLELIPGVKSVEGLIGKGVTAAANTGVGKSIIGAGESAAAAHPELAKDLGAVGNIAGVVGAFTGAGAAKEAIGGAVGKAIGKDALGSVVADVAPDLSGKGAAAAAAKGGVKKSGLFGTIGKTATTGDKDIAQAVVDNVPGFSKMNTFADKLNATRTAVYDMADKLKQAVVQSGKDRIYPFQELAKAIDGVDMPFAIKSDQVLERQFNLAREAALKIAQDKGGTISSLFDARKEFDQLVEKQFPTLYDRANAPMRDAITGVRNAMNDFIEHHLPAGNGFKQSLQQQSRLFRAIENMAPKATKEIGSNRFSRFAGRHPKSSGLLKTGAKYAAGGVGLGAVGHLLGGSH